MIGYLNHQKIPIPKHRNSKKPTTNIESLEAILLKREDEVLDKILELRHIKKAESYLSEAMVGPDGRIHPLYDYVNTGRLSSKRPNVMNLPQGRGSDIMLRASKYIRNSFLPDEGYVFVELDWRAIEPTLVAYFSGDNVYKRVCKFAHTYVLSLDINEPASLDWDDNKLESYLEDLKRRWKDELRYHTIKTANNAFNYKQGLYNMAKTLKVAVPEARRIRDLIAAAFPGIVRWQNETLLKAHAEGRLTNPFGHSRSFFSVLEKDGSMGREGNECLAELPQSTGASMLRWCLVELFNHPWHKDIFKLKIPIHDSILVQIKEDHVAKVIEMIEGVMERKWPELDGLSIEVESKWGKRMGEMKAWTN